MRIVAGAGEREVAEFLDAGELGEIMALRAVERRHERAASRIAAKSLAIDCGLVDRASRIRFTKSDARPVVMIDDVENALHVSFSHTAGIGAAALSERPVGIDLEHERTIDRRATKFFLSSEQLASATASTLDNALLHWWCAKEAAFKQSGEHPTLLRIPLTLERETPSGLVLRGPRNSRVETARLTDDVVVALAVEP